MQEVKQKLIRVGTAILTASRNELYLSMRFLDMALSGLRYEMNLSSLSVGTDGEKLLYNPRFLTEAYQKSRTLVNRTYLHIVLHCIFRHMFHRGGREEDYWNLACDIAVESVIDALEYASVQRVVSDRRTEMYVHLRQKLRVLTAEGIYLELLAMHLSILEQRRLEQEFWMDDHSFWQEEPPPEENDDGEQEDDTNEEDTERDENSSQDSAARQKLEELWTSVSERMQTELETFDTEGGQLPGELLQQIRVENRERIQYRDFLQKFVTFKEELHVDEDSYDPIFYTYGLSLYGNLPLIEALEYQEVRKIEELVIAIDTSESCPIEQIRAFLSETYAILSDRQSFFRKTNIHIIQCDAAVQSDQKITSPEELQEYMENFTVKGSGGTDFRPVFAYVEQMIEAGAFWNLKGLLYFTDGYGQFPKKKPPYDTAFLFLQESYTDVSVPPWAMKLLLEPDSLSKKG